LRLARRGYSWPEANMYDRTAYAEKLGRCGFVGVAIDSISNHVFPGFARHMALYGEGREWFSVAIDLRPEDFVAEEWLCAWRDLMGIEEYVIAAADKPGR
jgi:hypothetical protein